MVTAFFNSKLKEFVASFEKPTVSKISRMIDLLEIYGEKLGMPYAKQIGNNFYELRIRGNQEVRIFYCFHGQTAYFVHAFLKKTQKTPLKELETAASRIKSLTGR